jgi:membrane-bound lytic murein transglycosylase D
VHTAPAVTPAVPVAAAEPVIVEPPKLTAVIPPPAVDPVVVLIELSDAHFKAGQRELQQGHVEAAKQDFDRAISVLLESPYGGRQDRRVREHFDRLVDRISAYEVKALAEGDGFTEKKYEPATIDELLALSATFIQPEPTPELKQTVKTDLETAPSDIDIPLNQRVLAFVGLFQGRLHDFLEEGMKRGSKYLPMIQSTFRAEGLPLDLAYVPLVESAFKPNALSRTKAKGVWQFMRGTGLENGLRQDWYIDERSDPEKATVAAAKYLSTLVEMFEGDWHLALASYNGGPGRVQRAVKTGKSNDFWTISEKPRLLPRETRDYVPMILAAIVIAKNPQQYGFDFEPEPPYEYERVTLSKPVDLRRIAEWSDSSIDDIQALNPELRRWTTPVRDTSYDLKVPMGTAEVIQARLTEAIAGDLASLKYYTVKRGETLASVSKKLRVSRMDLAEANYLAINAKVAAGQQLIVPHEATVLLAAQADRPAPAETPDAVPATRSVASNTADGGRVKVIYQVKKGDTLASIARLFKTSVSSLQTWNRIPGSQIRVGERLTIYSSRAN